ncbi:Ger(x)C family germination protein [Bacillus sp. 3255]|nr:Ger(x)C family spore germination protein [Paenibacillus sp. MAHUQ-63]MDR6882601.1 Ger(x)C family germination protein [Bacillus sp. 3255]
MISRAAITLIACLTVSACGNQQVINKIQLVQTAGYDLIDGRSLCSVNTANYTEKGKANPQLLMTSSDSSFDMIPRLNTKTNKTIQYGQMGLVLFSKTYAEQGIGPVIGSFCRDAKISARIQMGVSEIEAHKLLAIANKSQESLYLTNMVEQNIESGNLPKMNFQQILFDHYGKGRDFYLPFFTLESGTVKIDGLALFKGDKFETKVSIREAFLLKLLTQSTRSGSLLMPMKGDKSTIHDYVLVKNISSSIRYRYDTSNTEPAVVFQLKLKVLVKDIPSWLHLETQSEMNQFEQQLSSYLAQQCEDFIQLCQTKMVDPLGLGDFVRSRTRNWNEQDFQASYSQLKTKVNVDLAIVQSGVGEL